MTEITSTRSDRVKMVRSLSGRPARSRTGRFLVEGPQGVREAVRHRPEAVRDVYLTAESRDRYREIVADAEAARVYFHVTTPEVIEAMSPDSQGVLAVLDLPAPGDGPEAALDAALTRAPRLVAVLSNVRDPGNAGAVIRAADAAGADLVVLTTNSVDIHSPKVVRSTAGSLFHLPVVTGVPLDQVVAALSAHGLQTLAADGVGTHDLDELLDVAGNAPEGVPDLAAPSAWVFGNEAWGLTEDERRLADAVVRVPIRGLAESLNLATAATVCLYASSRAQR